MLAPYSSEEMTSWPVSTPVGNVKNNDPSLIEPDAPICRRSTIVHAAPSTFTKLASQQ